MLVGGSEWRLAQNGPPEPWLESEMRRWGCEVGPQRDRSLFTPSALVLLSKTDLESLPPTLISVLRKQKGEMGKAGQETLEDL